MEDFILKQTNNSHIYFFRNNGAQSAPLIHKRLLTNTPDRRIRSTTTIALRKALK